MSTGSLIPLIQIFFCKSPQPGLVKRRLGAFIGMESACNIYIEFLKRLSAEFPDAVFYSGGGDPGKLYDLTGRTPFEQSGDHLGRRMANAFTETVRRSQSTGVCAILLSGTDVPQYTPEHARQAVETLKNSDCVIIPSNDGGYSMIGFRSDAVSREGFERIFEGIEWSTPAVLETQTERLRENGFSVQLADPLPDVDDLWDLAGYLKETNDERVSDKLPRIALIMPVLNEEESLPHVLGSVPLRLFRHIVIADNGSTDRSVEIAKDFGCEVTVCREKGYGATCLTAMDYLDRFNDWDYLLFLDADGSDDPKSLFDVMAPVLTGESELSLGERRPQGSGALQFHQRFGNRLAAFFIRIFWGRSYKDLGPLRCIRRDSLRRLHMDDRNFGWTIQMQIRALKQGMKISEVPVAYYRRFAGKSKVSGSLKGSFLAGTIILRTVWRELFLAK